MNDKYKDYNIIPIGDHCAISMVLTDLKIRGRSYPFDWLVHEKQIHESNIMYNIDIIQNMTLEKISDIVKIYIGNAFDNYNYNINKNNSIWFPHDSGNVTDIIKKYERRFKRLYNIFALKIYLYY
jgi:hypothetical protein